MISQERLKEVLDYNQETGFFYWKRRTHPNHRCKIGSIAGALEVSGYRFIKIDHKKYREHTLAWIFIHGMLPEGFEIDHINRVKDDNRICNLRAVSHADNMKNMKFMKTNTSGVTGVYRMTGYEKWCAQIASGNDRRYLGSHKTKIGAVIARRVAEIKYGYNNINQESPSALFLKELYIEINEMELLNKRKVVSGL